MQFCVWGDADADAGAERTRHSPPRTPRPVSVLWAIGIGTISAFQQ